MGNLENYLQVHESRSERFVSKPRHIDIADRRRWSRRAGEPKSAEEVTAAPVLDRKMKKISTIQAHGDGEGEKQKGKEKNSTKASRQNNSRRMNR